jgi:hypothetical protein
MLGIGLSDAVSLAHFVIAGGVVAFLGLFALSRRTALGSAIPQAIDGILGALVFAVVIPAVIVAVAGGYILQANTGYYGTTGDFRNSEAFVNLCWFCIELVAPACVAVGIAILGSASIKVWRAHRQDHPRGRS